MAQTKEILKKAYKILFSIIAAFIILMVIFNLLFSRLLKWQVDNFSDGKIHLKAEEAFANIFRSSILFSDVLVEFDSVSLDATSGIYLRNLKFSSLKIDHISIFQLLFKRNIKVGKIGFSDPELNFMRDTVISRQDLFTKVITPEVVKAKSREAQFSFDIGEISIDQGAMHFRGRLGEELDLEKINIRIRDVRLSDLSQMEVDRKDLSAHFKLNVNLYDIRKRFKDSYTFSIDSFSYYSGLRSLLMNGISLTPDSLDDFSDKPDIAFKTDFVRINGFDLGEFILNENLEFEKFQVSNGYLRESKDWYFLNNEDKRDTLGKGAGKGPGWLKTFKTDTFQVRNMDVLSLTKKLDTVYEVKDGNLMVFDILIDSGFVDRAEYLNLSENTFAHSGPLQFHWFKPVIDFRCDTFYFTGDDGREFMKNIRFSQHTYSVDKDKQKLLVRARIDSLGFKGLNIRRLLNSDSVHLSMFLKNPKVDIYERDSLPFENKKKGKIKLPSVLFLDDFRIRDGAFRFVSDISTVNIKVEKLNLLFDTLMINTNQLGKPGADAFGKASARLVDFDVFTLNCEGLAYQSSKEASFADIDNLFINRQDFIISGFRFSQGDPLDLGSKGAISFTLDGLAVKAFDIKDLVNKRELTCEDIVFQKPEFYGKQMGAKKQSKEEGTLSKEEIGKKIADALKGELNKLKVDKVAIKEGFVDFQNIKDSLHVHSLLELEMANIHYFPNDRSGDTLFHFPDYFQIALDNPGLTSSKFVAGLDEVLYNTSDDEFVMVNLSAKSAGEPANPGFKVDVPMVKLRSPLWAPENEQQLSFASIGVFSPSVFLEIDKKEKASNAMPKKKFAMPFLVSDSVNILAGKFKMQMNKPDDTMDLSLGYFDLAWKPDQRHAQNPKFENDLLAGVEFDVKEIALKSGKADVSLEKLYFDKQKNIIELLGIEQLAWKPATDTTEKKLKNKVTMPNLHIEYPHLYREAGELLGLKVANITGNRTDLEFFHTGGKNKKAPHFEIADSSAMKFLEIFEYAHIDSIYFPNIHIRVNTDTTKQKPIDFKRVSFHINGLLLDSSLLDPEKESYAEDVFIHLHDREIYSADSMYKFRTSYLTYNLSKDQIVFDSLEVIPLFEKDEFFKRAIYQTDRMQVSAKSVVVDGIDLESIMKTGEYHFDKISINELRLLDHRDQHYPRKPGQYRPLPKEMLENIPVIFHVDTVQVNDSYVLYGEYVDKSDMPGEVFFDELNASVYNVTNIFKNQDTSFLMTTQLKAKLMGSADVDFTINVPLMERTDYFWFGGSVKNLELPEFNPMTENLFGISIRRGYGSLDIPMVTANNSLSLGDLTFKYKNFKLAMYNRKKARLNRGIASPLIDFMMNGVLIKSNNPKFLGKTRVGEVYFERDTEKSIFNYIWKSVMSGSLSTMGFNKKEQRQAAKEKKKGMKEEKRNVGK